MSDESKTPEDNDFPESPTFNEDPLSLELNAATQEVADADAETANLIESTADLAELREKTFYDYVKFGLALGPFRGLSLTAAIAEQPTKAFVSTAAEEGVGTASIEALGGVVEDDTAEQLATASAIRGDKQCYLTYHMKYLAELHRKTMLGSDIDEFDLSALETEDFPSFAYKKTQILDSPTGKISELMPKLRLRPGTETLLDATTAQLANLVPMIKLYKNVYEEADVYEVPFNFLNHDRSGDGILGEASRSGVGIKSFDWQYISGNPDTIKKDITAKLVLFFQSFDELIKQRSATVTTSKGETKSVTYSYLDLVVNPKRREPDTNPVNVSEDASLQDGVAAAEGAFDQYDSTDYEIKASVGWAKPRTLGSELGNLGDALSYNRTNLFLHLVDHDFNINQDGTFELSISYRSRLEGILESPKSNILFCDADIINNSYSFKLMIDREKEIERLTSEDKCGENKKQLEEEKRKLVQIQDLLRLETYKFIILNMLEPQRWYGSVIGGRFTSDQNIEQRLIYSMLVDPDIYADFANSGLMPDAGKTLDAGQISTTSMRFAVPDNPKKTSEANIKNGELIYQPANPDEVIINFFYLGDLIDMLATTVFDNEKYQALPDSIRKKYSFNTAEVKNLRFLLGPMQFRDPATNEIVNANIADIPIAVDTFTNFFHEKVIKQQLTVYNFKSFIKDLIHGLARKALGEDCFDGIEQINSSMRSSYISVPVKKTAGGIVDPILAKSDNTDGGFTELTARVDMDTINNRNVLFDYTGYESSKNVDEHMHYVVLHMQSAAGLVYPGLKIAQSPQTDGLTPKQRDLDRGIKHLFIGRDRGLVLSVSFSKTNEPFLRQARLENAGTYDPILQLSDVYEANIELMGNTFFYPGSPLYLNPFGLAGGGEALGVPHSRGSISNIMGLGGYHIVTHVSSYIESGNYKTSIRARFMSNGDGYSADDVNREDAGGDCP